MTNDTPALCRRLLLDLQQAERAVDFLSYQYRKGSGPADLGPDGKPSADWKGHRREAEARLLAAEVRRDSLRGEVRALEGQVTSLAVSLCVERPVRLRHLIGNFDAATSLTFAEAADLCEHVALKLQMQAQPSAAALPPQEQPAAAPAVDLQTLAITLLFSPDAPTLAEIADRIGVDRATLYKPSWERFRRHAEELGRLKPRKGQKEGNPRRGHKTADGRVEAYDLSDEDE